MKPNHRNHRYLSAFTDMLFFNLYSPAIQQIGMPARCALYGAVVLLFYAPILWSAAVLCLGNRSYLPFLIGFILIHILSKLLFHLMKTTQRRFADAKKKRRFGIRILLVIEYIVLMWFIYLFYPIACMLFPVTMIVLFYEQLMGLHVVYDLLNAHIQAFIFYGGLSAYVVFLFVGGYKKMMTGLIPAYLRMYVILAAVSGLIDKAVKTLTVEHFMENLETFSFAVSQFFTLSNQALNIVSTFVMFAYAAYSLFTTCGMDSSEKEAEPEQP